MGDFDKEKITKLIAEIEGAAKEMGRFKAMGREDFLSSRDNYAIAEHYLRQALEGVLSLSTHIVSRLPGGAKRKDYTEILLALGELGVAPKDFAERIRGMAGYRNRLVHLYWEVSAEELHEHIVKELGDFEIFVRHIREFLKKEEK